MRHHFDAIVVGAGPAGNAAAYVMAKAGLDVLQLERGETAGAKNVQGAILYADALERLIPDFREEAPLERHVVEQRVWLMDERAHTGLHYRSDDFNEERPNRYTILRAPFDQWFASKVRDAGAVQITDTTVTGLVHDADGRVVGVETDRQGEPLMADVVVLGEGVNGIVGQRAGLRPELDPAHVALAVKETIFLSEELVQERFNLEGEDEGVVIELMGAVSAGMVGTGFLYTNRESVSVGVGCLLADFQKTQVPAYVLLDRLKAHPSVAPLLRDGETKEYVAHLIPEGGYDAIPRLAGDGWIVVGDAGQFVNSAHREGSNLAMTTGRLAGETVAALKRERLACTEAHLARYKQALEQSFVMKDLRKYRRLPGVLHGNKHLLTAYPKAISAAMQSFLRVDDVDKRTKERRMLGRFREARGGWRHVVMDALKMARAWR